METLCSSPCPTSHGAGYHHVPCRRALFCRSVFVGDLCGKSLAAHFAESSRFDLVDETTHVLLIGEERAALDARDGLAHVLLEVGERLQGEVWFYAHVVLYLLLHLVAGEGQHPAVRVLYEHDLLRPQQALGDHQRAELIVSDNPAGVAYDVRLALVEPEHDVRAQSGVHARDHGQVFARGIGRPTLSKVLAYFSLFLNNSSITL